MKLVIAEKPMLARDIARAICGVPVAEGAKLPISGNGYTVCACAGHLLELKQPQEISPNWKEWSLDELPIFCYNWAKKVSSGKEKLVNNIAGLLRGADCVIHAGDPDDEGQLIVDEVLEYLGWQGEVWRVFVNDSIEKNIRRSFEHLKKNIDCASTGRAAYARQMADMCFGVNETRLASCSLGTKLTVGRVQTPTLGLVVERDRLIENHVKQKFYELFIVGNAKNNNGVFDDVVLKFVPNEDILDNEKYILDKTKLDNIASEITNIYDGLNIEVKQEKEYSPLPFNLTKLQSEMSKKYKFNAQKTLDVTQALRDKYKAITYNRSDCQYLKDEHFAAAPPVLYIAQQNCHINHWQLDFSIVSRCFNENNVSAHHAIIPQEVEIDVNKMTDDERKVYVAIVERFAMQFMPPAVYKVGAGEIETAYGKLKYSCKELLDKGYLAQIGKCNDDKGKADKDNDLRNKVCLDEGQYKFSGQTSKIIEKETTPPKRYTEGTLIVDMSCIAKYVADPKIKAILKEKDDGKKGENGSIGTTATRAAIIEKLKANGYLEAKGNRLISSKKAREFYDILPDEIKKADTTAMWWLLQQSIEAGKENVNAIQQSVIDVFNQHRYGAYEGKSISTDKVVGVCPVCGQNIIKKNKVCECSSNKYEKQGENWTKIAGCGFKCWCSYFGKKLSAAQLEDLLAGKQVKITGLTSKKGKKYGANVKLSAVADKNGFFAFEFVSYVDDGRKKTNGYRKK